MEEIYVNVEYEKPENPESSTIHTGSSSSKRNIYSCLFVFLVLLSLFLLVGLIILSFHYHVSVSDLSKLSDVKDNLTERLQVSNDKLSSMTEARDLLNANLTELTKELMARQTLPKLNKTCPAGWRKFGCSCYLLSTESGSWDEAREDCRAREADLVVIEDTEEQTFLSTFTKTSAWIGLNDKEEEKTWKWVDGSALTLTFWNDDQPDNGGGDSYWGEEDCVHVRDDDRKSWNDISCTASMHWICEKQITFQNI